MNPYGDDAHHDIDDPRADDVETFRETHPAPCGKCNGTGKFERCDDYSCPDYSRPSPKPCACSVYEVWCSCRAGVAAERAEARR